MKKIFVIIAIIMAITLFPVFYIFNSYDIDISDKLSFYGEYISFLGAFSLGYFIYRKDEMQRLNESKKKCKLLLYCIEKAEQEMLWLTRGIQFEHVYYDMDWRNYYYDFESLTKGKYKGLRATLDDYFDRIEIINREFDKGNLEVVQKLIINKDQEDHKSIRDYNILECQFILMREISNFPIMKPVKPWYEKPETKTKLRKYSRDYFTVIENYIYAYMQKNNLINLNRTEIEQDLVQWLLTSPELKNFARWPDDERKIHKLAFEVSCMFIDQSDKLNFCWGEYTLK